MRGVGALQASEERPALRGKALWLGFLATAVGAFMINIDTTVVGVVLPAVSRRFALPVTQVQWVAGAYLLTITAAVPTVSRLAERTDRRRVFAGGYLAFVVGSLLAGLAPGFGWLVAARVLQGAGGAAIMTNVTAVVALIFPPPMRGRALGYTAAAVAAGTLLGPGLGGWLAQWWGWRSVFAINAPIGLVAFWGVVRYLPAFPFRPEAPFDGWGAVGFAAAAGALEAGLASLPQPAGWGLLAAAAGAGTWFVRRQKRAPVPLIPLRLFALPKVSRILLAGLAYYMWMMFPTFLLPLYLHQVRGMPLGRVGLVMMVQAAVMVVVAPVGGWMADRFGAALPARIGLALLAAAGARFVALGPAAPTSAVVLGLFLAGIGAGCFNAAGQTLLLNAVSPGDLGVASGLAAIQRGMGRSLGVALAALALTLMWWALGVGPTLGLEHPHYRHWLLLGLHGAFALAVALGVGGLAAVPSLSGGATADRGAGRAGKRSGSGIMPTG